MIDTRRGEVELSTLAYERFQPEHYDLYAQTWSDLIERGEAKRLTKEQTRCVYECNPSGRSVVTVARHREQWVGVIAAIPTMLSCPEGGREKAYQIGDFMVHPEYQRCGLGNALLSQLGGALDQLDATVYTFPNTRSIEIFLRLGYREVRSLRTVVFPLLPAAFLCPEVLRGGERGQRVPLDRACEVADEMVHLPRTKRSIEKTGAYLRWRYGLIRNPGDYVFSLFGGGNTDQRALLVWNRFEFRRIPVQVLVDHLGGDSARIPIGQVAYQGLRHGAWIGVCNLEDFEMHSVPLLSVRVPTRFDPRPGRLLTGPKKGPSEALLSECRFATGDWMGF